MRDVDLRELISRAPPSIEEIMFDISALGYGFFVEFADQSETATRVLGNETRH